MVMRDSPVACIASKGFRRCSRSGPGARSAASFFRGGAPSSGPEQRVEGPAARVTLLSFGSFWTLLQDW